MQRKLLFVDSSVIIFGIEESNSNSSVLLHLVKEKKLSAIISRKVFEEVKRFFSLKRGEKFSYSVQSFLKKSFEIIERGEVSVEEKKFKGKIKEKDLEHLATAKRFGARVLAFDRDYAAFKEYVTPKQLVKELGLKAFKTEY